MFLTAFIFHEWYFWPSERRRSLGLLNKCLQQHGTLEGRGARPRPLAWRRQGSDSWWKRAQARPVARNWNWSANAGRRAGQIGRRHHLTLKSIIIKFHRVIMVTEIEISLFPPQKITGTQIIFPRDELTEGWKVNVSISKTIELFPASRSRQFNESKVLYKSKVTTVRPWRGLTLMKGHSDSKYAKWKVHI